MTKFVLVLYLCSYVSGTCVPPYQAPGSYDNIYNCFLDGYKHSIDKLTELGKDTVNESQLFIRFICREINVKTI